MFGRTNSHIEPMNLAVRSLLPPKPTISTLGAAAHLSPLLALPSPQAPTHAASLGVYRRRRRDGAAPHLPKASQLRDKIQSDPGREDPRFAPSGRSCSIWAQSGFLICIALLVVLMASLDFCRWEACVPIHQEEGERSQVPRHREEDPGGE
jgi:hypothetical protein